ncbi:MAG: hypothetical protein HYI21_05615 [Sediminibacterium sp. Gen4]|jgi:hypothetical protein|uniref:hypothetical protein n=1 Tax=unclassified Sediminibacterium TaxID=2635961 RepID=UPI0015BE063C|nr:MULTISPECIES: hypothetical protein [unclassified Sediminibacterium]MBW0160801.1 hypothetical protein [Sediminibacterium sp.]MBW0164225.1 hypothetical protein [Sediminibacterium sp.]NWK65483.1 hypothetical protein [Sediminibacterium sp. Gen4]
MKKSVIALSAVVAFITLISFRPVSAPPKLYPELETYFKSVTKMDFSTEHVQALENLKSNISFSTMDYSDYNVVFYCSENSYRSQASQILLQTLCYSRKFKKVKSFSAGLSSTEVSPGLITYLTKIGYRITKTEKNGKSAYEVRFSDDASPVILYSKTTDDPSLPKKDITAVIVCDIKTEPDCANIKTEFTPFHLAYTKVSDTDGEEKVEALVKEMAAEMLYVTKK